MADVVYYRRFRLGVGLSELPKADVLPQGYTCESFQPAHLFQHATLLNLAFAGELDSLLFPEYAELTSCIVLLQKISASPRFLPGASLLMLHGGVPVGFIQTLIHTRDTVIIQNIAILPGHRRRGLGRWLLLQSAHNLANSCFSQLILDVTARNTAALKMYFSLGFQKQHTRYKEVPQTKTVDYTI
jgi:ribosomal protein S18 acetylase RimI-like enzyme